jgi:cell wall-associated NlpC family hydrolase
LKKISGLTKWVLALSIVTSAGVGNIITHKSNIVSAAQNESSGLHYVRTTDSVNFRTGPSVNNSAIRLLSEGTIVQVLSRINADWYQIKTSAGETGYMSAKSQYSVAYELSGVTNIVQGIPSYVKTKTSVNFRTGPATSSSVLKSLPTGTQVQVLSRVNVEWYQIKTSDGAVGYLSAKPEYTDVFVPAWVSKAKIVIKYGETYMGTPYEFGSARSTDNTFDCSDFVQWILNHNAISYSKSGSVVQAQYGTTVNIKDIQIGDIVFMDTNNDGVINHVGIYAGDNKLLHTYKVGVGVTYTEFVPGAFHYNHTVLVKRVSYE